MKQNNININFRKNQNHPGNQDIRKKFNKGNQPPRNNITNKLDIKII